MMKRILGLLTILSFATTSFSQVTGETVITKNYNITESKKQKIIAWALLGGGTAIVVTGMILGKQEDQPGDLGYSSCFDACIWLFSGVLIPAALIRNYIR